MLDKNVAYKALVTRILEGEGSSSRAQRRAAFDNAGLAEPLSTLIGKVAKPPTRVTDEDIAAVKEIGSERGSDLRTRGVRRSRSGQAAV